MDLAGGVRHQEQRVEEWTEDMDAFRVLWHNAFEKKKRIRKIVFSL